MRQEPSKVVEFSRLYKEFAKRATPAIPSTLIDALFADFIFSLVGDQGERDPNVPELDRNDAYLFEIGCYFLFFLDIWHINNRLTDHRERILNGEVVPRFIGLFQESMGVTDLDEILDNRLSLYFRLYREGFPDSHTQALDRIEFFFVELAKRTQHGQSPAVYDFEHDFPTLIVGIQEEMAIKVDVGASFSGLMQPLQKGFSFVYENLK